MVNHLGNAPQYANRLDCRPPHGSKRSQLATAIASDDHPHTHCGDGENTAEGMVSPLYLLVIPDVSGSHKSLVI